MSASEFISLNKSDTADWKKIPGIGSSYAKRIVKYRDHVFTFLYHPNVPPDNNGSERAIRNVKVKQKISGQFKILNAAENFAILRSIIDTAIKNNQNVVEALSVIAAYKRN